MRLDAILFDKDGTLFDFGATWNRWAGEVIHELADGCSNLAADLAHSIHFDLKASTFMPTSPAIAGTNRQVAEFLAPHLSALTVPQIERELEVRSAVVEGLPVVPLAPYLDDLARRGIALGVVTNDSEFSARSQLDQAGVLEKFDFVAGFDSGFGAKPDPDPLLAFCASAGITPARTAMVGDSTHDLVAGRAAGMTTIGVLTGLAEAEELSPFADHVLPDIGHIPDLLEK